LISWAERSRLIAHLLNPALIAAIEARAAAEYGSSRPRGIPWPLAFVIAPLVLHGPTRARLPRSTATHLSTWLLQNADLRSAFALRAASLAPAVREGLRFGLRHGVLQLENGHFKGSSSRPPGLGEVRELVSSAGLVGRWLARTENAATVFALFGIRP
jgi:hypothetical protein